MVVVPNIVPYDSGNSSHIHIVMRELEAFSSENGGFPDRETALPDVLLKEPSPYYLNGRQLPVRTVLLPNATGPFLDNREPTRG